MLLAPFVLLAIVDPVFMIRPTWIPEPIVASADRQCIIKQYQGACSNINYYRVHTICKNLKCADKPLGNGQYTPVFIGPAHAGTPCGINPKNGRQMACTGKFCKTLKSDERLPSYQGREPYLECV